MSHDFLDQARFEIARLKAENVKPSSVSEGFDMRQLKETTNA